jgi:hypothetical protein
MNKIILALLTLSPGTLWAGDCRDITPPNLTDLNWSLVEQYAYEDDRLGSSITYIKGEDYLTYYTYDLGLELIDDATVEQELIGALRDIYRSLAQYPELTSSEHMSMGQYVVDNMIAAGDFVEHAYAIEVFEGDFRTIDVVTIGSDGNCFFKVRYTAALEYPSASPLTDGIGLFAQLAHEFFSRISE